MMVVVQLFYLFICNNILCLSLVYLCYYIIKLLNNSSHYSYFVLYSVIRDVV
ncbi:hypothetical protein RhiirA5_508515 [Rhizophagus irregularis]|uniref:Uncharacterized protein n=1 Tax=Rhizophagus irregularis TaxID=588596 RepID=A0A2N0NAX7_9GLOM|nr:hypothetical protein RhiirA5_508515 [Rhizophagus irregularis]